MFESEDMKQKFKNFLMARNVYVNFEKGVEDNHGKTLEQYLDEFWPGSYITGAFLWETSIDGTTVWSMLEMEWHDFLSQPDRITEQISLSCSSLACSCVV